MRKFMLLLSILFLTVLVGVFAVGVDIYTSQEFYSKDNIAHAGFRSDIKENAIWVTVDGVENGYFKVKVSVWISNRFEYESAYIDLNDRLAGLALFDHLDLNAINKFEEVTYYESESVDYHGFGLFEDYPFDEHYLSSRARIVLNTHEGEKVISPDEFVYSVYLDDTFKITKLVDIPEDLGRGNVFVATDEEKWV